MPMLRKPNGQFGGAKSASVGGEGLDEEEDLTQEPESLEPEADEDEESELDTDEDGNAIVEVEPEPQQRQTRQDKKRARYEDIEARLRNAEERAQRAEEAARSFQQYQQYQQPQQPQQPAPPPKTQEDYEIEILQRDQQLLRAEFDKLPPAEQQAKGNEFSQRWQAAAQRMAELSTQKTMRLQQYYQQQQYNPQAQQAYQQQQARQVAFMVRYNDLLPVAHGGTQKDDKAARLWNAIYHQTVAERGLDPTRDHHDIFEEAANVARKRLNMTSVPTKSDKQRFSGVAASSGGSVKPGTVKIDKEEAKIIRQAFPKMPYKQALKLYAAKKASRGR